MTSALLLLSVILEFLFFSDLLGGAVFIFGVSKRLVLVALFAWAYFVSLKTQGG
jgi:hypothetical protein